MRKRENDSKEENSLGNRRGAWAQRKHKTEKRETQTVLEGEKEKGPNRNPREDLLRLPKKEEIPSLIGEKRAHENQEERGGTVLKLAERISSKRRRKKLTIEKRWEGNGVPVAECSRTRRKGSSEQPAMEKRWAPKRLYSHPRKEKGEPRNVVSPTPHSKRSKNCGERGTSTYLAEKRHEKRRRGSKRVKKKMS